MNCLQCEDRIQQLLDDRVDPGRDVQVQQHVESCSTCRLMLGYFACLDKTVVKTNNVQIHGGFPLPLSSVSGNQRNRTRSRQPGIPFQKNRQQILAVAIVMLVMLGAAIFVPMRPSTLVPMAKDSHGIGFTTLHGENNQIVGQQSPAASGNALLSDWIPTRFPNLSDVRFDTWSQVVSFVPKEPVDTVRGFPVALESVAPIYRYSTELPVVSQWAHGIGYTLNLLRARFPVISPSTSSGDDGFGHFLDFERSMMG